MQKSKKITGNDNKAADKRDSGRAARIAAAVQAKYLLSLRAAR